MSSHKELRQGTLGYPEAHLSKVYKWRLTYFPSIDNKLDEAFVVLRTNSRLTSFINMKKFEMAFQELSELEYQMVVDSPGFFSDSVFLDLLEALASLDVPWNAWEWGEVYSRYNLLQKLLNGKPLIDLNLYYSYLGSIKFEWTVETKPLRPFTKYSGYVKSPSTVGSKRGKIVSEIQTEPPSLLFCERRKFINFFRSKELDFNLLGAPPGSLLYKYLDKHINEKTALPPEIRNFIIYVSDFGSF